MSPPSESTAGDILREVDPRIWRACAGASVQIPSLYSRVYYFPQGHVEHCCASSPLISFSSTPPVPCLVSSIELLADPITDEVFAHLVLQPMAPEHFIPTNLSKFGRYEGDVEENKVITFAKILTPSDANNGGGFSLHDTDSVLRTMMDSLYMTPIQSFLRSILKATSVESSINDTRAVDSINRSIKTFLKTPNIRTTINKTNLI
ncbi:unnamed protein product [Microthlaspi erraticum]|uniref:Uncharacterized protein n=1 Tax=Microthlaspi erraticum TaxID=1685480 RepID=A0A6D2J8V1_9BRAS|nr:unnamed protein product [Microthlaspi erraticum]